MNFRQGINGSINTVLGVEVKEKDYILGRRTAYLLRNQSEKLMHLRNSRPCFPGFSRRFRSDVALLWKANQLQNIVCIPAMMITTIESTTQIYSMQLYRGDGAITLT